MNAAAVARLCSAVAETEGEEKMMLGLKQGTRGPLGNVEVHALLRSETLWRKRTLAKLERSVFLRVSSSPQTRSVKAECAKPRQTK